VKDVLLATAVGREGSTPVTHRCIDAAQAACFGVLFQTSFGNCLAQACHSSGHKSPASQLGNLGRNPGQYLWDLWWTVAVEELRFSSIIIINCVIAQMFHTSSS